MWPANQSLPNILWSPSTAIVTSCTRGKHSCAQWGREFQGKEGFKAQAVLGMDLYRQKHRRRCWQGTQTEFVVLAFVLSCKTFPSRYLDGHSKDSYQRQETELTSCSTKECKIWTFQTPVPPHWAQQLWTPGSRWTNGTVKEHHICTTSFQLHHVWNKCEGMDNPHLEYWWEHSNSNRKQINNHICVIGRNFSSKLSLRKMRRG